MPVFRASQSPGAWWGNSGTILKNTGLEDLTIDFTSSGASGIFVVNATNCWVKGVRLLKTNTTGSNIFNFFTVNVMNFTFTDNYVYGPPTDQVIAMYQMAIHEASSTLIQNNIFHGGANGVVMNAPFYGNVLAYNYFDDIEQASIILHGIGGMNLYEGNNGANFSGDTIHSSHAFETIFRNHWDGRAHNPSVTETQAGVALYSNNRFFNVVGNVLGTSHWTTYQTVQAHNPDAVFELGWRGTGSGTPVTNDANVSRTLMRWGNWDSVNNGTRFAASEVPSTIAAFPNSVPSSQTLPTSLYLSAKPSWFGSVPWPAVGPDVSNGNIAGFGGHANKIPSRLCFENTPVDSSYGTANVKLFDASVCYESESVPAAPANIRITTS
jgi:hypothetical protein